MTLQIVPMDLTTANGFVAMLATVYSGPAALWDDITDRDVLDRIETLIGHLRPSLAEYEAALEYLLEVQP